MAEEWRLESREKEKQIPPVTVREPICALVLQKWITAGNGSFNEHFGTSKPGNLGL